MMKFRENEIPIAVSMMSLADRVDHPFQRYFCYWAAFNNVYTLVSERVGLNASFELDRHGKVKTEHKWTYTFQKVKVPREHEQISQAILQFDAYTKQSLISHRNIRFFVERQPQGVHSKKDALGQEINGVLNINRTVNPNSPIWSPIYCMEAKALVKKMMLVSLRMLYRFLSFWSHLLYGDNLRCLLSLSLWSRPQGIVRYLRSGRVHVDEFTCEALRTC